MSQAEADRYPDLDQLQATTPASKPSAWQEKTIPYREEARRLIAIILLAGYLVLVVGTLIDICLNVSDGADAKDLITLLIASYTTLVGSALGYYFGRQES